MDVLTTAQELTALIDDDPKRALRRTAALADVSWDDVKDSGRLLPQHIAYCRDRGLHPFFVLKRGYVSVGKGTPYTAALPAGVNGFSDEQTAWILGDGGKHASLLIPLYSTDYLLEDDRSAAPVLWQARADSPRRVPTKTDKSGNPTEWRMVKFEAPAGAKRGGGFGELPIDVHPALHSALYKGGVHAAAVVLTEGIHKGDAIASAAALEGLSVVSASATGVTMPFYSANSQENPTGKPVLTGAMTSLEFETFDDDGEAAPRTFFLSWDADWHVNRGVYAPMLTVADLLIAEGCDVRIVDVPPIEDADGEPDIKTGIDDYLANSESDHALRELLLNSISVEEARFRTREYSHDDIGRGERLADRIRRDGTHLRNADGGYWMVYDAALGIWKEDDRATLKKVAMDLTRFDAERGDNFSRSMRAVNDAIRAAESQPGISVSMNDFDDPGVVANLLNVKNGVIDLRTGELLPHDPMYRMTQVAAFSYNPEIVRDIQRHLSEGDDTFRALERVGAPSFAYYLRSTLDDVDRARMVQECIGYGLIGRVMEEIAYVWHSPGGRSGKGILLELLQNAVFGDYETTLRPEALVNELTDEHLANLKGHRIAVMQETGEGARLNEVSLKQLASRDKVSGRQLYAKRENFRPSHLMLLVTNHLPIVTATDPGTWDRMILVTFPHTFDLSQRIVDLPDQLALEAPIIAAWFVMGAMAVLANSKPYRSETAHAEKAAWAARSDLLGQFVAEACVIDANASIERSVLNRAYLRWSDESGLTALKLPSMMRALTGREFQDADGKKVQVEQYKSGVQRVRGIRLATATGTIERSRRRPR